ncbi:MAG: ABC transporter ATP-binding protein [Elusimicrobiaceae bacterium]|nr:ABC transporter ATP-binding protein [Elusimicrobiaceae bacterium]
MKDTAVLQVCDLHVDFAGTGHSVPVVRGLSYRLKAGRVLAVVGESGSGKTVQALSLLGLLPPVARISGGRVLYQGKDLLTLPDEQLREVRGQKISMIFQNPAASLNPVLTVGEQLCETLRAHRVISRQQARKQAANLLQEVGIAEAEKRLDEYPFQFSGGMCQRVMIAMALALSPDVLIADEPTTALDVTIQAQILRLIKNLQQASHMAVVFITHNLALASQIADEVLVLYGGLCMEQAPAAALFAHPVHPYTQGLLASLVSVRSKVERLPAIAGQPPVAGEVPSGCPFAPRCPHATEKCRAELPVLQNRAGRLVRCWREEQK